jgi:hypothetical protein
MARSWDEGRREGRWDRQHLSDEEEKRIQKSVDDTMRAVIDDQLKGRAYDPWRGGGTEKVTPVGAPVVRDLPSGPTVSEPWRPMHKTQDWLRLGSTVASANVESAEKALREAGEEPEA